MITFKLKTSRKKIPIRIKNEVADYLLWLWKSGSNTLVLNVHSELHVLKLLIIYNIA